MSWVTVRIINVCGCSGRLPGCFSLSLAPTGTAAARNQRAECSHCAPTRDGSKSRWMTQRVTSPHALEVLWIRLRPSIRISAQFRRGVLFGAPALLWSVRNVMRQSAFMWGGGRGVLSSGAVHWSSGLACVGGGKKCSATFYQMSSSSPDRNFWNFWSRFSEPRQKRAATAKYDWCVKSNGKYIWWAKVKMYLMLGDKCLFWLVTLICCQKQKIYIYI